MKLSKLSLLLVSLYSVNTFANPNVVVFGDSLSDIGQNGWLHAATYNMPNGKLNKLYTQDIDPTLKASTKGGTDYAFSGGVIDSANFANPAALSKVPTVVVSGQIQQYLKHGVDKNAMHIVWAGGNDMAAILKGIQEKLADALPTPAQVQAAKEAMTKKLTDLGASLEKAVKAGKLPPQKAKEMLDSAKESAQKQAAAQTNAAVQNAVAKLMTPQNIALLKEKVGTMAKLMAQDVATLQKAGVNQIVLPTIPNVSITPEFQKLLAGAPPSMRSQVAQAASLLTDLVNRAITESVNQAGHNIVRINTNALFEDMLKHPQNYGLKYIQGDACGDNSSAAGKCTPAVIAKVKDPNSYLFADPFHPGPVAHKAFADYVLNVVNTPKAFAVLPSLLQQQTELSLEHLRHNDELNSNYSGLQVSVAHDQAKNVHMTHLNVAFHFNPNWQWQVQVSEGRNHLDSYQQTYLSNRSIVADTALRYNGDNYWLGALAGVNRGKFYTDRMNQIGLSTHEQQSHTTGKDFHFGVYGGYAWNFDPMTLIASADLTQSFKHIEGFNTGNDPLMQMYIQDRNQNSLVSGVELETRFQLDSFKPYVRTRLSREWHRSVESVNAYYNGSVFSTDVAKLKPYTWNVQAGVLYQPTDLPVSASVSVVRDLKQPLLPRNTVYQASLSYHF
ncbi:SGNH/GDSL hydrolase family protein [Actinobacillus delphinicola]|uniref:MapC protein n=1 Tax=Actinobacillus delphinicola TaxID=51161 RepID=A0A448TV55_9PAST|nr:SGNH/GDSL hydrolase family protein [Actinobacillus delphinicola]VEJ09812.1 MapC protein [Actinobacillus delphinicola]